MYRFMVFIIALSSCSYSKEKQQMAVVAEFDSIQTRVFKPKCLECHGGGKARGNVDLSTYPAAIASRTIVPGQPEASTLFTSVRDGSMPKGGAHLSEMEISAIKTWILNGALAPGYAPPAPPPPELPLPEKVDFVVLFDRLLKPKCFKCHNGEDPDGFFNVDNYRYLMSYSMDPMKIVVPGNPDLSLLYKDVFTDRMPAKMNPKLTKQEKEFLKRWIEQGAIEDFSKPIRDSEDLNLDSLDAPSR